MADNNILEEINFGAVDTSEDLGGIKIDMQDSLDARVVQSQQYEQQVPLNNDQPQNATQPQINIESQEKSYFQKFCPCLDPLVLAPYFDVTTNDIQQRLIASLMPFNQKFYMEYQKKPDLYGPFWIIWTLVVVLTIAGNLQRYWEYEDPAKHFTYTFNLVPASISILLGITVGLPVALRFVIKCFGNGQQGEVPILHGIGIYAYSFTSFLISSLLCGAIPSEFFHWILMIYSAATSILFIISTYWADLSTTLDSKKRMFAIAGICAVQFTLLLIFKLYFFKHMSPPEHLKTKINPTAVIIDNKSYVPAGSSQFGKLPGGGL